MDTIYLDNNATTKIDPRVVAAMNDCYLSVLGNPASQHRIGQHARQKLEDAREQIAEILNVRITEPKGDRLVFTSGGTEANNLAIFGSVTKQACKTILISSLEHPSVLNAGIHLGQTGCRVQLINARLCGQIDLDHLRELSAAGSIELVAVMAGNNETGVIQPIDQIREILANTGCRLHVDAIQWIGKIPFDFQEFPATTVSMAAHKFHGPTGIGALAIRRGITLTRHSHGGSQQFGTRPGTESVALAVGMAKALQLWSDEQQQRLKQMQTLRDVLETGILSAISSARVNGSGKRLPHTTNISFPGIDRQALLLALDFAGVACSTGSACESGSSEPSSVLVAMGLDEARISSSIRFSLSAMTTPTEIDLALRRIIKSIKDLGIPKRKGFSAS